MKKSSAFIFRALLVAGSVGWMASCAHHGGGARSTADGRVTHGADHLKDFQLAEKVDVRGLGVTAALAKLDAAYRETCRRTGETPQKLDFKVPPGFEAPLRVKLDLGTLDRSVRHVGAVAKLEVKRNGTSYHFTVPRETGQLVRETFRVPPDFLTRLGASPGSAPREAFRKQGLDLEDSTRFSYFPNRSQLDIETRSAGDFAAVSGLRDLLCSSLPLQQKLETKVFEVAAGSDWKEPHTSILDPRTAKRLFADLERRKDVVTEPLAPFAMRVGEESTIRLNRNILHVSTGLAGSGHLLQTAFTRSQGVPTEIHDKGYVSDSGTRLSVKTRPDGSRVVFAVTPTLVDATGRPVHPPEP